MAHLADERESRAGEVRQRILEGAARAFAASGFSGTSVPTIASQAEVSVGLLYRYFPSKAELFASVCNAELERTIATVSQALAEISNPRERLRQGVRLYLRHLQEDGAAGLVLSGVAASVSDPHVRRVMQLRLEAVQQFIESRIQGSLAAGELSGPLPLRPFVQAISLMLEGVISEWAVSGEIDPEVLSESISTLIAAALPGPACPATAEG